MSKWNKWRWLEESCLLGCCMLMGHGTVYLLVLADLPLWWVFLAAFPVGAMFGCGMWLYKERMLNDE